LTTEWSGNTSVQTVTIRAVGKVEGHIDVAHARTPETVVTLVIGSSLIRLYRKDVVHRIRECWQSAAVNLHRLPDAVSATWLGPTSAPVGIVVRIGNDVTTSATLMPASGQLVRPYLRIQVGPLVWQVIDRAAYESITPLWDHAHDMLA
jgi:hypothetical protein